MQMRHVVRLSPDIADRLPPDIRQAERLSNLGLILQVRFQHTDALADIEAGRASGPGVPCGGGSESSAPVNSRRDSASRASSTGARRVPADQEMDPSTWELVALMPRS
jgi:hypothetical protein